MNYNDIRRKTKTIKIGNTAIGGTFPIAIQSMTNTRAEDFDGTYAQIKALEKEGCEIVRISVPNKQAVEVLARLKESDIKIPIVADIHFDYRLAIDSVYAGADKIRINPGNIGGDERVKEVANVCRSRNVPIRIGVNSGSLEKHILSKYGSPTAEALAESAMYHIGLLEKFDFTDIVISIKASSPYKMIQANKLIAKKCDYPLHLGVTEAGGKAIGSLKSAIGIGGLLCEGIGDTIRVSLTDSPIEEVRQAKNILCAAGFYGGKSIDVVSCPTCGRTGIDLISIASEFERRKDKEIILNRSMKVAIMGCVVNGPGEASDADIGIAGGAGCAVLFKKGKVIRKVSEDKIVDELISEINKMQTNEE